MVREEQKLLDKLDGMDKRISIDVTPFLKVRILSNILDSIQTNLAYEPVFSDVSYQNLFF